MLVDERSGVGGGGLLGCIANGEQSVLDRFRLRPRVSVRPFGKSLVGVFGIFSIAAQKLGEIGDGSLFLGKVDRHRIRQRPDEAQHRFSVACDVGFLAPIRRFAATEFPDPAERKGCGILAFHPSDHKGW
jgi:hypothetical protein